MKRLVQKLLFALALCQLPGCAHAGVGNMASAGLTAPCSGTAADLKSDLCAQWTAAEASQQAARWAYWSMIVSAVGVVGLAWNIGQGRAALRRASEANDLTKAAEARAARQFAEERVARDKESLPAVLASDAAYTAFGVNQGEITLWLENVGKQAAIDVYVVSRERFFMAEGQYHDERNSVNGAHIWRPKLVKHQKRRAGAVGTNPRSVIIPVAMPADQIRNSVILEGAVVYSDANGQDFISQFYFYLPDDLGRVGQSVPMTSGTLRMATFEPYDGPELRDREGY